MLVLDRYGLGKCLALNLQQSNTLFSDTKKPKQYLNSKAVVMEWPPKSPDLSPIEQVWSYIKNRNTGTNFNTEQKLYDSLRSIWWSIPNEMLENFHSSFLARCIIVSQI